MRHLSSIVPIAKCRKQARYSCRIHLSIAYFLGMCWIYGQALFWTERAQKSGGTPEGYRRLLIDNKSD
jgi:heme/copper-type cytochrome/quinol oxidase subunit 3